MKSYGSVVQSVLSQVRFARNPHTVLNKGNVRWIRITGSTGTGKSRVAVQLARDLYSALSADSGGSGVLFSYGEQASNLPPFPESELSRAYAGDLELCEALARSHIPGGRTAFSFDALIAQWASSAAGRITHASGVRRVWLLVVDEYQNDALRVRALLRRIAHLMFKEPAPANDQTQRLLIVPILCGLSALGLDRDDSLSQTATSQFQPIAFSTVALPDQACELLWRAVWSSPTHAYCEWSDSPKLRAAIAGWPRGFDCLLTALGTLHASEAIGRTEPPVRSPIASSKVYPGLRLNASLAVAAVTDARKARTIVLCALSGALVTT